MLRRTKEEHRKKIEEMKRFVVRKEMSATPPYSYPSELRSAKIPENVVCRLAFVGISTWRDIGNWEASDLLPLALIRTITKSSGLGPAYWKKLREYYVKNVATRKCVVNALYDVNDEILKEGVLIIIEADHPIVLMDTMDTVFISNGYARHKKIYKGRFGLPMKEMAVITRHDKVDRVIENIKYLTQPARMKIRIKDIYGQSNVEKYIDSTDREWEKRRYQENGVNKESWKELCAKIQKSAGCPVVSSEGSAFGLELPLDMAIIATKEFKKEKRKEVKDMCYRLRRWNIEKAIKKCNSLFHKSPGKLIKRRRAILEDTSRKKLIKVKDVEGNHNTKEKVVESTYKYYSGTAAARPISENCKYDFLKNCQESVGEIDPESLAAITAPISMTETLRKVFQAGNRTAPESDGIPYEVLKALPDCALRMINKIQNIMLEKAWCPDIFISGDVFLLAKTSDPTEHKHWRPICLQSTIYKIQMAIMSDRILHYSLKNNIVSEEQKGFCPVSGCFDHSGLLLNIIENFRQNKGKLYILFVDFFNAYGSVDHRRLIQTLRACKIPDKVVNFIKCTLEQSSYRIHTGFGPTNLITLFTGLKQGDPAAPVLFIIFLEALIRTIKKVCKGYNFKYPFPHKVPPSSSQEFADDIVFTTDEEREIHTLIEILEEFDKWSNMKANATKCGSIAVESDGEGDVMDITMNLMIGGEEIPSLGIFESYKYLGYCQNIMGNQGDMSELVEKKIEKNIKLIDTTPIHKWHKVTMAQWLLASLPKYFLVGGRIQVNKIRMWNKNVRAMIRRWIGVRNIANSVIHLPTREYGLGVADMEDVNDERKITVFCQFIHSNDARLKESTIANLRMEVGRRKAVIGTGYDVLAAPRGPSKELVRKFTLLHSLEKIIIKYGLTLCIDKEQDCWCAFAKDAYSPLYRCNNCGKMRHEYCDPPVKREKMCIACKKDVNITLKEINNPLEWKRYQDNRYNWREHVTPIANPVWELLAQKEDNSCVHHVFRHENGVWGVDLNRMKDALTIKVKASKNTSSREILHNLNRVIKALPPLHTNILVNRKEVCNALGNWVFGWVNRYHRTSTGTEPAAWSEYENIIKKIKDRLPNVTMISFDPLSKEDINVGDFEEDEDTTPKPAIGIHHKGKILGPKDISKKIKELQVEKHKEEWLSKIKQGIVGRVSQERTTHTTYFMNSNTIEPEEKITFLKLSLGLMITKVDKKRWGYIEDAWCALCHQAEESIHHLLTSCPALKHLYITRHNVILRIIMKRLVVLENLGLVHCDVEWDTVTAMKHNKPDIVIIAPSDTQALPKPFNKNLEEDCVTIIDLTICWDEQVEDRRQRKIERYVPLLEVIKKEMDREKGRCDAISIGVLGSISENTMRVLNKYLGIDGKEVKKLLKEINISLVKESCKIWKHAASLNAYL